MKERVAKARNEGVFTPPASTTRSRCRATRADRTGARPPRIRRRAWCSSSTSIRSRSCVSRTSRRAPCRGAAGGGGSPLQAGFAAYQQHCSVATARTCRAERPGRRVLVAVTDRMGEDAIKAVVTGGRGLMRPVPGITEREIPALIAYLATTGVNRPGRGGGAMQRQHFLRDPSSRAAAHRCRRLRRAASDRSIPGSAATRAATSIPTTSTHCRRRDT